MPLMDIAPLEAIDPLSERGIRAKIFGLMMWPNDEVKRFGFVLSSLTDLAQQIAVDNDTGLTIDAETSRLLRQHVTVSPRSMIEVALRPVVRGAVKSPNAPKLTGGEIAGQILIHAVNRVEEGHRNIGLNDCLARVSEDLQRLGAMSVRPKDLKPHWHEYRSVAPLWASWLTMARWAQNGREPKPGLFMPLLLIRAERFRMDGEVISHRNSAEPLLPPGSTWQLPNDTKERLLRL